MVSIKEYVALEKQRLKKKIADSLKNYRLDVFQIGNDERSNAYIRGKKKDCEEVGIECVTHRIDCEDLFVSDFGPNIRLARIIANVANNNCTDGIILQLPVPEYIDAKRVISNAVYYDWRLDVDGFVYKNHVPCTARGIIDWLEYNDVDFDGKNVTIIGRSDIVGKPLAKMMTDRNATVTLCHSHTDERSLYRYCDHADIIVCAVGKEGFLNTSSFDCGNTIIIDVGINVGEDGKLHGDVYNGNPNIGDGKEPPYITPVPGGVGLLTRLALLKNVIGE